MLLYILQKFRCIIMGFPFLEKLQEQAVKDTDEKIREKEEHQ